MKRAEAPLQWGPRHPPSHGKPALHLSTARLAVGHRCLTTRRSHTHEDALPRGTVKCHELDGVAVNCPLFRPLHIPSRSRRKTQPEGGVGGALAICPEAAHNVHPKRLIRGRKENESVLHERARAGLTPAGQMSKHRPAGTRTHARTHLDILRMDEVVKCTLRDKAGYLTGLECGAVGADPSHPATQQRQCVCARKKGGETERERERENRK